jgi:hypothetical protein
LQKIFHKRNVIKDILQKIYYKRKEGACSLADRENMRLLFGDICFSHYRHKKTAEPFSSYYLGEYPPDIPRDIRRAEL